MEMKVRWQLTAFLTWYFLSALKLQNGPLKFVHLVPILRYLTAQLEKVLSYCSNVSVVVLEFKGVAHDHLLHDEQRLILVVLEVFEGLEVGRCLVLAVLNAGDGP